MYGEDLKSFAQSNLSFTDTFPTWVICFILFPHQGITPATLQENPNPPSIVTDDWTGSVGKSFSDTTLPNFVGIGIGTWVIVTIDHLQLYPTT